MENFKRNMLFGIGIAVGTFIAAGIAIGYSLRVKRYCVEIGGVENEVRIVMLSDLHNVKFEKLKRSIISKVRKCKPDVIMLAGDINVDKNPLNLFSFIYDLREEAPVYYVRGNHDNDYDTYERFIKELGVLNVVDLNDKCLEIEIKGNKFNLIGFDDIKSSNWIGESESVREQSFKTYNTFRKCYNPVLNNLVVSHRPNYLIDVIEYENVIGLCGHTHGGQFRLPNCNRGFLVPDQKLLGKYSSGAHVGNNSLMFISSGLGNRNYIPRFYNPQEIVLLKIKGE